MIGETEILHLKTIVIICALTQRLIIRGHGGRHRLRGCQNLKLFLSQSCSMHIVEIIQENFFKFFRHWFEITNERNYFVQELNVGRFSNGRFDKRSFRFNSHNQKLGTSILQLWVKLMKLFFNSHLFHSALGTIAFR